MAEPIDIADAREARMPHKTGRAGCGSCGHQWQAVAPTDIRPGNLECPECHTFQGWFHDDLRGETEPVPSENATVPYGRVLTTLHGLKFVYGPPDRKPNERPKWAYVTNTLGEQVWIYSDDNLYLTHADKPNR